LNEAAALVEDPEEILEPDGPVPYTEGWRVCFHRGTLSLLLGRTAHSATMLEEAMDLCPSAEVANNLGVAHWRLGDRLHARSLFETALRMFPEFADARVNLDSREPTRVTTHPLRVHAYRRDYEDSHCLVGAP
jgi:tetratricopeptide (TPR) repeat protein